MSAHNHERDQRTPGGLNHPVRPSSSSSRLLARLTVIKLPWLVDRLVLQADGD